MRAVKLFKHDRNSVSENVPIDRIIDGVVEKILENNKFAEMLLRKIDFAVGRRAVVAGAIGGLGSLLLGGLAVGRAGARTVITDKFIEIDGEKAPPFGVTSATVVVAASDSKNKDLADYVCSGAGDEEVIYQAMEDLPDHGGKVVLLDGTYNINSGIPIRKSNVELVGVGHSTVIRLGDGANDNIIKIGDTTTVRNITIRDLQIDGNKANQTESGYPGIVVINSDCENIAVINCYIHDVNGDGILLKGSYGLILGNIVSSNAQNGIAAAPDYGMILGNVFASNQGDGVHLGSHQVVVGNVCNSNGGSGIRIYGGDYNIIMSNLCISNSDNGIELYSYTYTLWGTTCYVRSEYNAIIGNVCKDNSNYGVNITTYSRNNVVIWNNIIGNTTGSINDEGEETVTQKVWVEDKPILLSAESVAADATGTVTFPHSTVILDSKDLEDLQSAKLIVDYTWAATADGYIELYDETAAEVVAQSSQKTGGEASEWEEIDVTGTLTAGNTMSARANITTAGDAGEQVSLHRAILKLYKARNLNILA